MARIIGLMLRQAHEVYYKKKEAPVDEDVDVMLDNFGHLCLHLLLLRHLQLCHLSYPIHPHSGCKHLQMVTRAFNTSSSWVWRKATTNDPLKAFQTLILSVSMGVLAMRMRAFSILLGWLMPTFLSSRKPDIEQKFQ